jgi:phenylalanyl-tRNA synthetase beta chain
MFYSRKLLNRFLPDLEVYTDEEIVTACNSIGTEVENIIKHPKLENLVVGRLISYTKHPDADKLNVCKVDIGGGKINTIVCGARNLVKGKNVVVALEGCRLYDGRIIEYKELRGIKSEGMLCAYEELTPYNEAFISKEDAEGIMLFKEGEIGDSNVAKLLGLDDTIYQIDVPFANRNDFNGAYALCQELAGYFQIPFKVTEGSVGNGSDTKININLDRDACYAYSATLVEGVDIKSSS